MVDNSASFFSDSPGQPPGMATTFVAHYSEIALKGRNRPEFVRMLKRNLGKALLAHGPQISAMQGRIFIQADGEQSEVARKLSEVFGLAWFAEASDVRAAYEEIQSAVLERARSSSGNTFKIDPRRSDKSFPIGSHELASRLGAEVVSRTGKKVNLSRPEVTLHVDVVGKRALVYSEKLKGLGGLPVGTAGRVMHLFSGGIDSPVAAWLLMKRGCRPVYVHFYLAPTAEAPLGSKVTGLVRRLSVYGGKSTLVLLPFSYYQLATFGVPEELEPSLFRRFMRLTAEALAPRFGASGVSTGDSLSQTASQTLWNIGAFDEGSSLPVLRPLLTYDKEEIVSLARRIGTYELSLEEYRDCCSIISRHPRTRAKASLVSKYSAELGFRELAWKTIEEGTLFSHNPSTGESRHAPLSVTLSRAALRPSSDPRSAGGVDSSRRSAEAKL